MRNMELSIVVILSSLLIVSSFFALSYFLVGSDEKNVVKQEPKSILKKRPMTVAEEKESGSGVFPSLFFFLLVYLFVYLNRLPIFIDRPPSTLPKHHRSHWVPTTVTHQFPRLIRIPRDHLVLPSTHPTSNTPSYRSLAYPHPHPHIPRR